MDIIEFFYPTGTVYISTDDGKHREDLLSQAEAEGVFARITSADEIAAWLFPGEA